MKLQPERKTIRAAETTVCVRGLNPHLNFRMTQSRSHTIPMIFCNLSYKLRTAKISFQSSGIVLRSHKFIVNID